MNYFDFPICQKFGRFENARRIRRLGGSTTTTSGETTINPPEFQQPNLEALMDAALAQFLSGGPRQFGGTAPESPSFADSDNFSAFPDDSGGGGGGGPSGYNPFPTKPDEGATGDGGFDADDGGDANEGNEGDTANDGGIADGSLVLPVEDFNSPSGTRPGDSGIVGINPLEALAQQMALDQANAGSDPRGLQSQINTAFQGALQGTSGTEQFGGENFRWESFQNETPIYEGAPGLIDVIDPFSVGDVPENPYLSDVASRETSNLFESLTNQVLPNIRSEFIGQGALGSTRQGIAEGLATGQTADAAGDLLARLYSDSYGQGLNYLSNLQSSRAGFAGTQIGANVDLIGQAKDANIARELSVRSANLERELGVGERDLAREQDIRGVNAQREQDIREGNLSRDLAGQQSSLAALGLSGDVLDQQLRSAEIVAGVGEQRRGFDQAYLDEIVDRFNAEEMAPIMNLLTFSQMIRGNYGSQNISETQSPASLLESIFGVTI